MKTCNINVNNDNEGTLALMLSSYDDEIVRVVCGENGDNRTIGDRIALDGISGYKLRGFVRANLPWLFDRRISGGLPSGHCALFEITTADAAALMAFARELRCVRAAEEIAVRRRNAEHVLSVAAERNVKIYETDAEARAAEKEYNNAVNEGGFGFVPHFLSREEVRRAEEFLERI